jgi:hypothetical protein
MPMPLMLRLNPRKFKPAFNEAGVGIFIGSGLLDPRALSLLGDLGRVR